jgi:hypothetical protein
MVSFPENSPTACAYWGVVRSHDCPFVTPKFQQSQAKPQGVRSVHIFSDCLSVLNKVEHLPPNRIPSRCKHLDVLKNIMTNCSALTFHCIFSHVKAHQDDLKDCEQLNHIEQLNCGCNAKAQLKNRETDPNNLPAQRPFPLEPITLFIGGSKVTMELGPLI